MYTEKDYRESKDNVDTFNAMQHWLNLLWQVCRTDQKTLVFSSWSAKNCMLLCETVKANGMSQDVQNFKLGSGIIVNPKYQ